MGRRVPATQIWLTRTRPAKNRLNPHPHAEICKSIDLHLPRSGSNRAGPAGNDPNSQLYLPAPLKGMNQSVYPSAVTVCKTDAAWSKLSMQAGLAWTFSNLNSIPPITKSNTQSFDSSPFMAEALAMRLALIKGAILGISILKVFSANQTLMGVIFKYLQVKEIHGIVADIHQTPMLSSLFLFLIFHSKKTKETDVLANLSLRSIFELNSYLWRCKWSF